MSAIIWSSLSLLWICIIAACPFRPSRDRCSLDAHWPPAALATGEGFAGWTERTGLCVGVCRIRTFTDQQCWWDTNTNPSSWWNLPPTLAVPMVTHRIGTALQLTAYLNVLVYVCACELKDLRCALWSVHPCNPQAGFLGITNQPIRALTLSSLFLSLNPHTQKPYRIDGLF